MQRVGPANNTSMEGVKAELKNDLRKWDCVLRASLAMMSWEIQNKGIQRNSYSCDQSRNKETVELEWSHLGSSFPRLDKGDPRWVG